MDKLRNETSYFFYHLPFTGIKVSKSRTPSCGNLIEIVRHFEKYSYLLFLPESELRRSITHICTPTGCWLQLHFYCIDVRAASARTIALTDKK